MLERHFRPYLKILYAGDCLAIFPALYVAYHARYYLVKFAPLEVSRLFNPELLPFQTYLFYLLAFLPLWIGILSATQRYSSLLHRPQLLQAGRAVYGTIIAGSVMGLATYSAKLDVSRPIFFAVLLLTALFLVLNRMVLHGLLRSRSFNEHNRVRILIVGTGEMSRKVGTTLESSRKWGYHLAGYVAESEGTPGEGQPETVCTLKDLPALLLKESIADEVIFAETRGRGIEAYEETIRLCEDLGIRARVMADFLPYTASKVSIDFLDRLPLLTFSSVPEHSLAIVVKRFIDVSVATVALVVTAPLMLLTAAAIKYTSPGPVIYLQQRCGLYGRKFRLAKFRTMIDGAEDRLWEIKHLNEMAGPVFKMRNDPRVTTLGRFLRRYSIDELPQFWNVLRGEMSIVGPRAPLLEEVEQYTARQRRRLSVKPGITCLWQVSGRSDIDFERWMEMDLKYIDDWSVWVDLQIILKTIPAVFTGRGAR